MCFAPQRRALCQHLNFQKCSEAGVLCAFWLGDVLRATAQCTFSSSQLPLMLRRVTTACTFSTSQLPKVLRPWCVLCTLTSKCASRRNGAKLFISHLPRWLRTRRFSEPTFRPSGATNMGIIYCFATFLPFRPPASSFFWLFLFSDLLSSSLRFSDSSHLCFFICPYCRKFGFKTSFVWLLFSSFWLYGRVPMWIIFRFRSSSRLP